MAKIKGQGHILQAEVSGTYTTIAQRVEIGGPTPEMNEFDTTDLDSDIMETLPTILNPGEVTLKIFYDPNSATHQRLTTDLLAGTIRNYRIQHPDGLATKAAWVFPAFVKSFNPGGMKSGEYLVSDVTFRITDTMTLTPGS